MKGKISAKSEGKQHPADAMDAIDAADCAISTRGRDRRKQAFAGVRSGRGLWLQI